MSGLSGTAGIDAGQHDETVAFADRTAGPHSETAPSPYAMVVIVSALAALRHGRERQRRPERQPTRHLSATEGSPSRY